MYSGGFPGSLSFREPLANRTHVRYHSLPTEGPAGIKGRSHVPLDVEYRFVGPHPEVVEREDKSVTRRDLATRLDRREDRGDAGLLDLIPGRTVGLHGVPGSGLTRLGLSLLVEASLLVPVAVVDVRGWMSPLAAWEVGIRPERLVIVRPDHTTWARVIGSLLDGIGGVYAEVPRGIPDMVLRRVAALARKRRVGLVLRPLHGHLPVGVAHLTVEAMGVEWEGTGRGHGHIRRRSLRVTASGKAAAGTERMIEIEDDGTDTLRMVGRLAPLAPRRSAG